MHGKDRMSLRKLTLAVLAGASVLASMPAGAQYYDPYRPPAPRYDDDYRYERRPPPPRYEDEYRRPRYDDGYRRPDYGRPDRGYDPGPRGGAMCVTSRGTCPAPPIQRGSPCRCDIPGFGVKRGAVQ